MTRADLSSWTWPTLARVLLAGFVVAGCCAQAQEEPDGAGQAPPAEEPAGEAPPAAPTILRHLEGLDAAPRELEAGDRLEDPWFRLVLTQAPLPDSLQEVLDRLKPHEGGSAGLLRRSFFLGEGGQIPTSTQTSADFARGFRFTLAWTRSGVAEIFLGTPAGARAGFLEVMAWDPDKRAFNYYERKQGAGGEPVWIWKGDSSHALQAPTRTQGCFACHINGGPVMRELRQPWNNWHSEAAGITATVPDEIRFQQPRRALFRAKEGAQVFEDLVRRGIKRWDDVRGEQARGERGGPGTASLLRQLFQTTTANLISSQTKADASLATQVETVDLPLTLFVDAPGLEPLLEELPALDTRVARSSYEGALAAQGSRLRDVISPVQRDTFFAVLVPERAQEDRSAVLRLLEAGIISPRFAASVLMVDFPNPVDSAPRAALFELVREEAERSGPDVDLSVRLAAKVLESVAGEPPATLAEVAAAGPSAQFAHYWTLPADAWQERCRAYLEEYFSALRARLQSAEGVADCLRLAVSRRAAFASRPPGNRMTGEAPLLFPITDLNPSPLRMGVDGRVRAN